METEFGIEVEDDAIEKVKTVGDMARYIEEKMECKSPLPGKAPGSGFPAYFGLRDGLLWKAK